VLALMSLFGDLAKREHSQDPHQPVDPTPLREALGRLPGGRFQVGQSLAPAMHILTMVHYIFMMTHRDLCSGLLLQA